MDLEEVLDRICTIPIDTIACLACFVGDCIFDFWRDIVSGHLPHTCDSTGWYSSLSTVCQVSVASILVILCITLAALIIHNVTNGFHPKISHSCVPCVSPSCVPSAPPLDDDNLETDRPKPRKDTKARVDAEACSVCLENERCIAFVECGHLCLCNQCADTIMTSPTPNCPICRISIFEQPIHIFQ